MKQLDDMDIRWIVRRLPKPVRDLLEKSKDVFLAGGFIRSCIANETVNDVDLFTSSKERSSEIIRALANGETIYRSDNAESCKVLGVFVQAIHRWTFSKPEDCVQSFDFTIARAAVWHEAGKWLSVCDDRFYEDLAAKRLVYCSPVRNEDAGGSMLRLLKFYQRGYRAPLGSVGAVVARMMQAVKMEEIDRYQPDQREQQLGKVLSGLLIEVDPNAIDFVENQ